MSDATARLLRVTRGESVTLRLDCDPARTRRALARAGDWTLAYTDRQLPATLRAPILAIGQAFARTDPRSPARALELLEQLVAAHLPGATTERAAAASDAFPRWSGAIRSAPAQPGELWPFDVELSGLRRGVRQLIKRDGLTVAQVEATLAWFAAHDVATRVAVEADGRRVVFAGLDAPILARALEAEAALAAHDADSDDAAAWLGHALGYPSCCVARFLGLAARDDAALAEALLPALPARPASPLTMWLHAPLSLHSHAACSLECAATRALGLAALEALDRERAGFADWWLARARRLHVVDREGRCHALAGDGELDEQLVVRHALTSDPRGKVLAEQPELVGAVASVRAQRVVVTLGERELVGALAADHRGAP